MLSRLTSRRVGVVLAILTLLAPARAGEPYSWKVAPGFVVEKVAPESAVRFPMFAAFDDGGRMFVAESSGLDLYAELTAGTRKCRVSVLEDRDGDGRFEHAQVFADKLVYPMGLAWRDGRLFVADPPDLVALEDTDGDGRADRRTVILTGFGHLDNGSLHGLTFGPDGSLFMTMGMPDGYRIRTEGGGWLEGKSGALLQCRPDGSRPEVVCRGFVNLVEATFLPGGEIIGTDNWFQEPAGGFRDSLVHLVEGGLYPYVRDEGTPQPITGDPLPPVSRFPAVALSGLVRQEGPAFPAEYRGDLFSAQHNSRAVGRHVLIPQGSTFRSEDSTFLTTEDPDFHPSDVLMDADGSLIVVDTGAWYVQHCPTGRIRASQSKGGLYRIRWERAPRTEDPWGRRIAWASQTPVQLASLLSDPRPLVRDRAGRMLAARGHEATALLKSVLHGGSNPGARTAAVWALSAIDDGASLAFLGDLLGDADLDVACASARVIGKRSESESTRALEKALGSPSQRLRLAAAEALARCGDAGSLPALWDALAGPMDRFLEHALIHAAHRIARVEELEAALDRPEPKVQGAALLLLDQYPRPRGRLHAEAVMKRAGSPDERLRHAALMVLGRHPEWAGVAIGFIRGEFEAAVTSPLQRIAIGDLILALRDDPAIHGLLSAEASRPDLPADRRARACEMMSRIAPEIVPDSWVRALQAAIVDPRPELRRKAVRAAATLGSPGLDGVLRSLADDPAEPAEIRLESLRAMLPRQSVPSPTAFEFVIGRLGAKAEPAVRLAAAELIGQMDLDEARRVRVLDVVRRDALISPGTLRRAFRPPIQTVAASRWADYLEDSLRSGWRPSEADLRGMLDDLSSTPEGRRRALLRLREENADMQRSRLGEFQALLTGGDPIRGQAVFAGPKAACATCHRIGPLGGGVGPDLTRIGAIRSGSDLLESIVFPSSTFSQGFEPYIVSTTGGRVLGGVIAKQDGGAVVLRDAGGAETRVRRSEIEEMRRSESSIMPEGLANVLGREELRDLLAFLAAQR